MRLGHSILWWLALTLSALVLGGSSLLLLQRERGRLQTALDEAERSQVQAVGERLATTVHLAQDQLGAALANGAWQDLEALERTNPLVRNVFVFDPEARMLRQPDPHAPGSMEEEGFLRRYETLFADRHLWWQILNPPNQASNMADSPSLRRVAYRGGSPMSQYVMRASTQGFWLPWSSDNRLHMIGGVQIVPGGPVYGVEIEMVTLVSRLSIESTKGNWSYASRTRGSLSYAAPPLALFDGTDRPLLVTEGTPEELTVAPDVRYPIGQPLPHWQLVVYRRPDAGRATSSLTRAATALVVIMVIAILGGGATLFADARRSRRDARQRTTFVANVSHELKTPLTSIRMYSELLRDNRVPDDERRQRFLDTMVQEGERLTRLIDNVLDFGRLEQSRRNYNPRPIDLAADLRGTLEVEAPRLKAAGLELATEIPEDLPIVTDPDAVRQIVLNLLENAAKYAAAGRSVSVSLARADGKARLTVQDAGPGIPMGCRERVFGMFERLDNSLEGKAGSGLGLAIARGLARGLGGDLVCTDHAGPGARFTLTLPLKDTPMNTAPQKVLVVEDDRAIREGLIVTLESEGYAVAAVDNGSDALSTITAENPDLVLLDIMLPGRNGYDVCRDLRRTKPDLPVIMLTAKGEEIDKVIGLELGADDYVTKPFGVRELLARIGAVLRRTSRSAPSPDADFADPFTFGQAHIDPAAMRGELRGETFDLTPRELRLLEFLHDRPGMVLSREKILHEVWDYEYVGATRTLDQHIAMLRKKVEPDPRHPQAITTVHGAGYRYEGD